MSRAEAVLERLGGLDVLASTELVAGDIRFLTRYFLPDHGRYRRRAYSEALAGLQKARSAADLALRGRLRRILGQEEQAEADWAAALKRDARCALALAFRGEGRTARGAEAALRDLDRALSLKPAYAPALLWRAYALACLGRGEEALRALDGLLARRPSPAAFLLRGLLRERAEDLSGAEADYSAVLSADSRSPGLFTLRAALRCKKGDTAAAAADAAQGILLHPENIDGYVRILHLRQAVKTAADVRSETDILLRAADELLAADPRCAWAHAVRAGILGRSDLQLEGLRRAVELDPDSAWMRAFLGRALGGGGRASKAEGLRQLGLAHRLAPQAGWILCWRAEVRRQLGDFPGARADLDEGLALDPDYRLGLAWRAFLRDLNGDLEGALADLTNCLEALPRVSFLHLRARLRLRAGEAGAALEDVVSCMAQSTPHALAYGGAGWLTRLRRPGPARLGARFLTKSPLEAVKISEAQSEALARQEGPRQALGLTWLARLRLDAGRDKEALPLLTKALRRQPGSFLAHCWLGEVLCRLGRPRQAVEQLARAVDLAPRFLPALLWRAASFDALGRRAEALEEAVKAHENEPEVGWAVCAWLKRQRPGLLRPRRGAAAAELCALAELDLRAGKPRRARSLLRRLRMTGMPARGLLVRGLAEAQLGGWPAAQKDLLWASRRHAEQAARLLPLLLKGAPGLRREACALAYACLAEAESARGRRGEAARWRSSARGLSMGARGGPGLVLALKSEALRLRGNLSGARKTALDLLARQPSCAKGWFALGQALRQGGEERQALKAFGRALRLDPADGQARAWQAEVLRKLGRPAQAGLAARRAAGRGAAWALALEGELGRQRGRKAEAWKLLSAAFAADPEAAALSEILGMEPGGVRQDPAYAWLYAWRGILRRRQGRWREAEEDLTRALSLDPGCFWARACRGECRLAAGRAAQARCDLDAALRQWPGFPDARIWRGRALYEAGDFGAAYEDFRRALEAAPDNVWAMVGAGVCLEKLGRGAAARRHLLKAKRLAPALFLA